MKLDEIVNDSGSFIADTLIRYLEQGRTVYADINGDMGTLPFYGKIASVTIVGGSVVIALTTSGMADVDDFNPAVSTFDDNFTLKTVDGKITLVDLE